MSENLETVYCSAYCMFKEPQSMIFWLKHWWKLQITGVSDIKVTTVHRLHTYTPHTHMKYSRGNHPH